MDILHKIFIIVILIYQLNYLSEYCGIDGYIHPCDTKLFF